MHNIFAEGSVATNAPIRSHLYRLPLAFEDVSGNRSECIAVLRVRQDSKRSSGGFRKSVGPARACSRPPTRSTASSKSPRETVS